MDSQARFLLDQALFEDLKSYLEGKKVALQDALLLSIARPPGAPFLPQPEQDNMRLRDAVDLFEERWQGLGTTLLRSLDEESLAERLSNILWNYIEILEGMGRELFDQLLEVPVDEWDQDLYDRLDQTKIYLALKLKEIDEFTPALESSLRRLFYKCNQQKRFGFWKQFRLRLRGILDPELLKRVHEAELYLHNHFVLFAKQFVFLKKIETSLAKEEYKFQHFALLSQLEKEKQRQFRRLWRLLKIWEVASREKVDLSSALQGPFRTLFPPGKTTQLLREYLAQFKQNIFQLARQSRVEKDIAAQAVICSWRAEMSTLIEVISSFRRYLLLTENGGKRWPLAQEPRRTRELLQLGQESEQADQWLATLFEAQELSDGEDIDIDRMKFKRVDKLLLDMGQPLISRSVMKRLSSELVNDLTHIQELCSPLPEVSELMLDTLLCAVKIDQKHETLIATPGFLAVWEIHRGLSHLNQSAAHLKRLKLYKKVTQHLKHWLLEHELTRHTLEAEHEIHDIQAALQEFYHSLDERLSYEQIRELQKELLAERLFFAHFFQFLREKNHEGLHMRTEFAFVDNYFNAIDDRLRALS